MANVARRDAYLDSWLTSNTRSAELRAARYTVEESDLHGHPAIRLKGGLSFGLPMIHAARDAARLQRPSTRFAAAAWECAETNKVYTVSELRPANAAESVSTVADRLRCHAGAVSGPAGE